MKFVVFFLLFSCKLFAQLEFYHPRIIATYPHDTSAFTQGLAYSNGFLYESTGLYGQSSLRKIDLKNNKIVKKIDLPSQYFAEGIAIVNDTLIQLTWNEQTAFYYDLKDLNLIKKVSYKGQGWGLCRDGNDLLKTDGSSAITTYQTQNLKIMKKISVFNEKRHISNLNDLECVENTIFANVWLKDYIVKIDKNSGKIMGVVDASNLLTAKEKSLLDASAVLNGIAYNPDKNTFFITGKYWPWIFEVEFD